MEISNELHLKLDFGKRVNLNYGVLDEVCNLLNVAKASNSFKPFEWRDQVYWPNDVEGVSTVSQFFAVGNAINFRYWWIGSTGSFEYCQGPKGGSIQRGANYMWRSLRFSQTVTGIPILDAKKLAKISINEMKKIFMDDQNRDLMPVLKERQKNLRDLGTKLDEYWDGQFYNLVKETKGSLFDFVRYSREFRAFDDPLCKMPMVNAIMHQGRGLVRFDSIFPGIDYQLLKLQMRIGAVIPDERLTKKLQKGELLGHKEARELRNAGLMSFLYLMGKTSIPGDIIDNIWWRNRDTCNDTKPVCEKCMFKEICQKKIAYGIPREITRYY